MHAKKKALLTAGMIAGLAALTGCTANTKPESPVTPKAMQQQTAQSATADPEVSASPEATISASAAPDADESPAPLRLSVDGKEAEAEAISEHGELLLPLEETGEKLGWKEKSEQTEEETQTKRVITLEKDDSHHGLVDGQRQHGEKHLLAEGWAAHSCGYEHHNHRRCGLCTGGFL